MGVMEEEKNEDQVLIHNRTYNLRPDLSARVPVEGDNRLARRARQVEALSLKSQKQI